MFGENILSALGSLVSSVDPAPYNAKGTLCAFLAECKWAYPKMADERKQTAGVFRNLPESGNIFSERVWSAIKATGKKLLPQTVIQELQGFRAYSGIERALYLKMRILNGLGLANPKSSRPPKKARSFLFVCFGNIMRSPMCEALMNRALAGVPDKRITVGSAGLNAAPGREAHQWAVAAARELGISLQNHHAKLLTAEMVEQADVIFAMDYQNQVQLLSRYPQTKDKVFMLGAYAGEDYHRVEISDPYYDGEAGTRDCYKILDTCIRNLVNSLSRE